MNIGIAVYSMQVGGTERVVSILANSWASRGHEVWIYTLDNARSESFYKLAGNVQVRKFGIADGMEGATRRAGSLVRKYYELRKTAGKAGHDVLISFTSEVNVLVLASMLGAKVPVVVSERSDPRVIPAGSLWRLLRRMFYHRLPAAIVVQSKYAADYFDGRVKARLVVIPNPVETAAAPPEDAARETSRPKIVAVGRLVREKRYDLLIEAINRLLADREGGNVDLVVVGEGPMQGALEKSIADLGMEGNARLIGFRSDPWQDVNCGDIYVQCSDFEGFPNAMCEAMSRGCAVISTVFSPAVTELIKDNISGILIAPNSVSDLYHALKSLLASPDLRRSIGNEARKAVRRYDPAIIGSAWINGLEEVAAGTPAPLASDEN